VLYSELCQLDSLENPFLCGLALADHFEALCLSAGFTANDGLQLDPHYPAVSSLTLEHLPPNSSLVTRAGKVVFVRGEPQRAFILAEEEAFFVDDLWSLAKAEAAVQRYILQGHCAAGVRFVDPEHVVVHSQVAIGANSLIWPSVVLMGETVIGDGVEIQSGCWVEDCEIGDGALLKPHSVCTGAKIGPRSKVGPMAHLRPGTVLEEDVKVGNFVETKKTRLHQGAKASHLTYLGDAEVGEEANIGAGTITCNYDGFRKYPTSIGPGAFIGSNTALVAPVKVGANSIVGAGSVITRDVPDEALAVERGKLRILEGKGPDISRRNRKKAGK
jgi:bifunctional UDP-N-acetylglucosamine pyrophosphorylase / glucosamine-1-phosphate N-acetyltransferase